MNTFTFEPESIALIGKILAAEPHRVGNDSHYSIAGEASGEALTLTLADHIPLHTGDVDTIALVKVQTRHGYFELHDCSGFVVIEPDEIIFYSLKGEFLSCMVVGREGTCSVFMNVLRENLSADFGDLDSHLLMSSMQLSLIDTEIPENI